MFINKYLFNQTKDKPTSKRENRDERLMLRSQSPWSRRSRLSRQSLQAQVATVMLGHGGKATRLWIKMF